MTEAESVVRIPEGTKFVKIHYTVHSMCDGPVVDVKLVPHEPKEETPLYADIRIQNIELCDGCGMYCEVHTKGRIYSSVDGRSSTAHFCKKCAPGFIPGVGLL